MKARMVGIVLTVGMAVVLANSVAMGGEEKPAVVLLDYEDFGPQVIAHELLGNEWFQWNKMGGEGAADHIVVVVYSGETEAEVQKEYPVDRVSKHDYRYVSRKAALAFLKKKLAEIRGDKDLDPEVRAELVKVLSATEKKIRE